MGIITLKIEPWDTVMFRDGTLLDKKTSNYVESRFFPYPSVFYGAICTSLMENGYLNEVHKTLLERNTTTLEDVLKENLKIRQIYLEMENEIYLPAPRDLMVNEDGDIRDSDFQKGLLYTNPQLQEKVKPASGKYISLYEFMTCYDISEKEEIYLKNQQEFAGEYQKTGIELEDNKKIAKKEHLYFTTMRDYTYKNTCFLIEAEIHDEISKGFRANILLGGEARMARLELFLGSLDEYHKDVREYNKKKSSSENLKLIFTTPFIMKNEKSLESVLKEKGISVLSKIIGKPETAGGWDMAKNKPKELKKVIPEGSLYLLKSSQFKSNTNEQNKKLLSEILSDVIIQKHRGFGSFILGNEEAVYD